MSDPEGDAGRTAGLPLQPVWRIMLVVATLVVLILGWVYPFLQQDKCLDAGGRWIAEMGQYSYQ
jgi:hypothetical protein